MLILFTHNTYGFMAGIDDGRATHGEIEIIEAYIPIQTSGIRDVGYLKFKNLSDKKIIFHQFTSPVWDFVEIQNVEHRDDVSKMRKMDKLVIPGKSTLELKPGSAHLKLIGPRRNIKEGDVPTSYDIRVNQSPYFEKCIDKRYLILTLPIVNVIPIVIIFLKS